MNGSKCVVACAGDKHLYTVLEQQQAQIAQGNLMGSDHTYVIPQAAAGAAAVKGDHRVVQPRGESPFCKCPAAPVYPCYAVACVTLFFHGLLNVHLPWPVYCLCAMASCCCVTACLTSKCHGWCIFAVLWPACCSCAMACLLFMCMK